MSERDVLAEALHGTLPNCIAPTDPYCYACHQVAYNVAARGWRLVPPAQPSAEPEEFPWTMSDGHTLWRRRGTTVDWHLPDRCAKCQHVEVPAQPSAERPDRGARDHPFKDEWSFQRSMSWGNAVAGQPIAPDQPCFICEVPFTQHAATERPDRGARALAVALMTTDTVPMPAGWTGYQAWSDRILANGAVFLPDGLPCDNCQQLEADFERLRRIEAAAHAYLEAQWDADRAYAKVALRAALHPEGSAQG